MTAHALKLAENAQARIAKVIELEKAGTCSLDTLHVARNDRDRALIALGRAALADQSPSQTAHPTEGEMALEHAWKAFEAKLPNAYEFSEAELKHCLRAALFSTQPSRPQGEGELRDKLRTAFMKVQQAKRGGAHAVGLEPLWAIVNMVPAVLYVLDGAQPHPDVSGLVEALRPGDLEWLSATIYTRRLDIRTTNSGVASLHNDRINRIDAILAALQSSQKEGE